MLYKIVFRLILFYINIHYTYILTAGVLYIEDCQHFGRTVRHTMTHSASFMTHYDEQCDFGNFEALADF